MTRRFVALDGDRGIGQKGASGIFCRDWNPLQWPQRSQALAASGEIAVIYDESRQGELFMPMSAGIRLVTLIRWVLMGLA